MKKKISILLAVIMILSCISVCAAPSVDYVFYDEDDDLYYVFGSYYKGYNNPVDIGVKLNGEEFSYIKDGNTSNFDAQNEKAEPKFGISFKAPKEGFEKFNVQAYRKEQHVGNKVGDIVSLDVANNQVEKSSDATLKSLVPYRKSNTSYDSITLVPAFSPDITQYTMHFVYGTKNATSYDYFANMNFDIITSNSKATYEITSRPTSTSDKYVITVTAEDKVNTKTYEIALKANNNCFVLSDYTAAFICNDYTSQSTSNYSSNNASYDFMRKYYTNANYAPLVINFSLTDTEATTLSSKKNIVLGFNARVRAGAEANGNIKLVAKPAVVKEKVDRTTITQKNAIDTGKIEIGEDVINTMYLSAFNSTAEQTAYSIDVTDYVKKQIADGNKTFAIALMIDECSMPVPKPEANTYYSNYLYIQVYSYNAEDTTTNNNRMAPHLSYSAN